MLYDTEFLLESKSNQNGIFNNLKHKKAKKLGNLEPLYVSFWSGNRPRSEQCSVAELFAQKYVCVPPGSTFSNSTFCPHGVFMCSMWISEQTAIISLYSIN
jgi:hypothetical protein